MKVREIAIIKSLEHLDQEFAGNKENFALDPSSRDFRKKFGEGSFGEHEVKDRLSIIADQMQTLLLDHPTIAFNNEYFRLVKIAQTFMEDLLDFMTEGHVEEGQILQLKNA